MVFHLTIGNCQERGESDVEKGKLVLVVCVWYSGSLETQDPTLSVDLPDTVCCTAAPFRAQVSSTLDYYAPQLIGAFSVGNL